MEEKLKAILAAAQKAVASATSANYEDLRVKFLGRKAELSLLLRDIKNLSPEEKRTVGQLGNQVRRQIEDLIESLNSSSNSKLPANFDPTLPGILPTSGHLHPVTQMTNKLVNLFAQLGYTVAEGPEVELEEYNFDLLNIPANHPARDEWDTFWIKHADKEQTGTLLRTHTSPVQIRYMLQHQPPIRIIAPGRTFRYEAEDATHGSNFNQIEGLLVDENISIAHLKGTLQVLVEGILGPNIKTRLRPSFFPFTEPSFEIDAYVNGRWLELMGCGMVNPKVLKNCGIDPEKYSGFAFGGGIDRLVMLRHGITDIRQLLSGNTEVLKQF